MSRRRTKLLVAAAAVLSLAGCANLRPGVAAEVGDTTISMDRVDAFAKGLCETGVLSQNRTPMTVSETRQAAVSLLVRTLLAHDYAASYASTVPQSQVDQVVATQVEPLTADLSEAEREDFLADIREFIVADQLVQSAAVAQVTASGGEVTQDSVIAALEDLWGTWSEDADVELDPRFGTWDDADVAPSSGSLSVPATTDDEPSTTLPGARACG